MLYYTHLFTCISTQMFKGCVGHLLQHFMPARVFVLSIILKIKTHTYYRVIMRYFHKYVRPKNLLVVRFDDSEYGNDTAV